MESNVHSPRKLSHEATRKRAPISRPKILSPLLKKKQGRRVHHLVFGPDTSHRPNSLNFGHTTSSAKEVAQRPSQLAQDLHEPEGVGLVDPLILMPPDPFPLGLTKMLLVVWKLTTQVWIQHFQVWSLCPIALFLILTWRSLK